MPKYRVHYHESERDWGSDDWDTDYDTPKLAMLWVDETNKKYFSSAVTPDYYITARYVGPVEAETV